MISGVGCDLLTLDPVRTFEGHWDHPFFRTCFTDAEYDASLASDDPVHAFALRYSAKRAALKALGLPPEDALCSFIECGTTVFGALSISLQEGSLPNAPDAGIGHVHLAQSETPGLILSFVAVEP